VHVLQSLIKIGGLSYLTRNGRINEPVSENEEMLTGSCTSGKKTLLSRKRENQKNAGPAGGRSIDGGISAEVEGWGLLARGQKDLTGECAVGRENQADQTSL